MFETIKRSLAKMTLATLRSWSLMSHDPVLIRMFGGKDTFSGQIVNADTAMQLTSVYACVSLISKTSAMFPLHLLRVEERDGEVFTNRAIDHPLYRLLKSQWNPYMTSFQARQMMHAMVLLHGNSVAEIEYDQRGQVKGLWPWPNTHVRFETKGFQIRYFFRTDSQETEVPAGKVLHLKGLSLNGNLGLSPIQACRETIGEGLAADEYAARFYANNARPGGVLELPTKFESKELEEKFVKAWQDSGKGENAYKIKVLQPGMKFTPYEISHEDAQFLETRKFTQVQICSIYGVAPHLIGNLDRSTNNNIEQQGLEFSIYNQGPWIENFEQTYTNSLLTPDEQKFLQIKHNMDALLRGDATSRWQAHKIAWEIGAKNANEIRRQENWNPRKGGDQYHRPANWIPDDGKTVTVSGGN